MGGRTRVGLLAAAVVLLVVVVFHAYVRIFATVAYTYLYWGLLPKSINWITEGHERTLNTKRADSLVVPKLIHQTWVDTNVPEKWRAAQKSCMDAHPASKNYTYKLWTDEEGLDLIREEYPWFLPTYTSYPYSIQRVDAVRYFILHKYGGIYLDLDMGCNRELTFMRYVVLYCDVSIVSIVCCFIIVVVFMITILITGMHDYYCCCCCCCVQRIRVYCPPDVPDRHLE